MARTYQCYQCGQRVDEAEVRRVQVRSGKYSNRRVNMCPTCADRQEGRDRIVGLIVWIVVAVFAGAIVLSMLGFRFIK